MSDDFSTPEERRAQKKAEKSARERLAQDDAVIQSLMARTEGRTWVHDLLAFCQVFGTTFTGEALSGAFKEGQRNVGLRVFLDIMRACPDAYVQMMGEQSGGRPGWNKRDPDEPRNWDGDEWIGDGEQPE